MEQTEKDALIGKLMKWKIEAGDEAARANRYGDNKLYQFNRGVIAALEVVVQEIESK